ncbi:MAG: preprotein translocase subunit SecY [Clostridia bacterium]|nr:preprotein translocase subunit SecY [Clostridia bacterium]
MLKTIYNAWKVPELRKKLIFTIFIVIIFRIGSIIPVPFLDVEALKSFMDSRVTEGSFFGFVNMLSGGAFSHGTLFALSIQPYINSSIIMQLMAVVIPSLEKLQKEGEEGRKKITAITRVLTVVIGVMQAFMFYIWLRNSRVTMYNAGFSGIFSAVVIVATLTAGTALIMWLGEQINDKGMGNGISILLFAGIVARMPTLIATLWGYIDSAIKYPNVNSAILTLGQSANGRECWYFYIFVPVFVVTLLVLMWLITYTNDAERRIPIQYAKRVVGRKMYGGQSTHIPIKLSGSGVMPIIFAQSILSLPSAVKAVMDKNAPEWINSINDALKVTGWVYPTIYFVFIIFFAYFYLSIQYNPIEMANNLRQSSGTIPGIRPGKPTSDYIAKVLSKITLMGAIFLGFVAIEPFIFSDLTYMYNTTFLGGTSVIIMVGVALETVKQMESQMMMRHYKGFLD